jgi:pimeloyl-ACP methyl ester carboxylesterase
VNQLSNTLKVAAASLVYDVQGAGPVLLMIPVAPADATMFSAIVPLLADRYTVVTYDPRGLSRSVIDCSPDDKRMVETLADDVHRLLAAVSSKPAFVPGSGGANVGLELAVSYAEQVHTLVAHEPALRGIAAR